MPNSFTYNKLARPFTRLRQREFFTKRNHLPKKPQVEMTILVRLLLFTLGTLAVTAETVTEISVSSSASSSSDHVITADSSLKNGPMIGVTRKARRPVYPVLTNYRENNRTLWADALFSSAPRFTQTNTPMFTKQATKHVTEQATERMTDVVTEQATERMTEQITERVTQSVSGEMPLEEELEVIPSYENDENSQDVEYSDESVSGGEDLDEKNNNNNNNNNNNGEINDVIKTSTSKITFSPLRFITSKRKQIALRPFQFSTKISISTNVVTSPPETPTPSPSEIPSTVTSVDKPERNQSDETPTPNEVDTKSTAKALPPTINNRVLFPIRSGTRSSNSVLKPFPRRNKVVENEENIATTSSILLAITRRSKLGAPSTTSSAVDENDDKTVPSTTSRQIQRFRLLSRSPKKMKTTTPLSTTSELPSSTLQMITEPFSELTDTSPIESSASALTEHGFTYVTTDVEPETPQEKSYDQPSEMVNEYAVDAVQEHWPQMEDAKDFYEKETAYLRK